MKHLFIILILFCSIAGYAQNLTGLLGCTNHHGVDSVLKANGYAFSKKSNATEVGKCFATIYYTQKNKSEINVRLCNDTLQSVTFIHIKKQLPKVKKRFINHFGYVFLKETKEMEYDSYQYWECTYQSVQYPHISIITSNFSIEGGKRKSTAWFSLLWDNEVKGVKF